MQINVKAALLLFLSSTFCTDTTVTTFLWCLLHLFPYSMPIQSGFFLITIVNYCNDGRPSLVQVKFNHVSLSATNETAL